jgi:hypothetical protein
MLITATDARSAAKNAPLPTDRQDHVDAVLTRPFMQSAATRPMTPDNSPAMNRAMALFRLGLLLTDAPFREGDR